MTSKAEGRATVHPELLWMYCIDSSVSNGNAITPGVSSVHCLNFIDSECPVRYALAT